MVSVDYLWRNVLLNFFALLYVCLLVYQNPHNTRGSSPAVQSSVDRDMSPEMESMRWTEEPEESGYRVSSDSDRPLYHCSYCSYSTPVFNNMRIHGSIHPGNTILYKCFFVYCVFPPEEETDL
jgi:hypothetical protein